MNTIHETISWNWEHPGEDDIAYDIISQKEELKKKLKNTKVVYL